MINKYSFRSLNSLFFALLLIHTAHAATIQAPDFELPTKSGNVKLTSLKNKVVYLDFWASWCTPCRKSFPWMNEIKHRYSQQGLEVVAVNLDQDRAMANKFLQKIPAQFTVAFDPEGDVADRYKVQGMPSSFIIDRNGKIVKNHLGFREKDTSELESLIRGTLEQ